MKGRILALGALLALCALLLTACGRGGVKSEKEIMADMQERGVMDVVAISDVPIEKISSLKILKRQTNKELKNDFVYVTVEADTETAHFVCSMKLTYNYYDDQGWVLDEYEPYAEGENSTKPLKGPDNSVVDDFFEALHRKFNNSEKLSLARDLGLIQEYVSWSVESIETDLQNCSAQITVTASRETYIIKTEETFVLLAEFSPNLCAWSIPGDSVKDYLQKLSYEWKIEPGFYVADEGLYLYALTLNEINTEENIISLSLEKSNKYTGDVIYEYSGAYELKKSGSLSGVDLQNIQGTIESNANLDSMVCFMVSADLDVDRELDIVPGKGMYCKDYFGSATFINDECGN